MAEDPICTVEGCDRPVLILKRGWCRRHYRRWQRYGDPTRLVFQPRPDECDVEGCTAPVHSRRYCAPHYRWWWKTGTAAHLTRVQKQAAYAAREQPGWQVCRNCDELKPLDEFTRKRKDGDERIARCRTCVRAYGQATRERNLARAAMRNYGLTPEEYAALMADRRCHVCGTTKHQSGRRLHIDHCHVTQKVRGLLCHACNTALGLVNDDPDRLKALIHYLELHAT